MKRVFTSSLILFLFLSAGTAIAQKNDFNFIGAGARAAGMGNAFIGVSDDATAISWNPAGLSQLIRPEASVVARYTSRDMEFKYDDETFSNSISTYGLNFASLVIPFKGELNPVLAVSFQNQLDFSTKSSGTGVYQGLDYNYTEDGNIMVNTISAAFAMKFGFFHTGLTVNRWFSTGDYSYKEAYTDFLYKYTEDHTFSATSFTVGVLADFEALNRSLPLKLGVKFTPPFDLEDEIESDDGELTGKATFTFEMPMTIGVGLSYRILDALTIAADYEMNNTKDKLIKAADASVNLSESNENMNQIRAGAEYLIITDNFILPLRAGYKTNPTRRADVDRINNRYSDQVFASSLNFGIGLIFSNISFDLAYEYMNFDVKYRTLQVRESESQTFNYITLSGIIYF